jgi:transcription initiation factor TFIIIB Brf1 subunit/transcription initiation factor TFIIB
MASILFPSAGTGTGAGTSLRKCEEDWSTMFETNARPTAPTAAAADSGYVCPDCTTGKWVSIEEEEIVCTACGNHLGYLIDSTAEYRWFGTEDRSPDPSRVGNPMNPLLPESSLGTRILARPGDSKVMRRIRQYHLWNIMPYRERTLWNVFEMLHVRASNAGISLAIVEEAKQLYAQVSPLCICRGQQKDALLAACLYESLKRHDTPRRPADIADMFQIDSKLITRGVKQFSGLLEEHLHASTQFLARTIAPVPSTPTVTDAAAAAPTTPPLKAVDATNTAAVVPALVSVSAAVSEKKTEVTSTSFRHYLEPAILRLETPRAMHASMLEAATHIGDMIDELGVCPETTPSSLAACSLTLACEQLSIEKANAAIAKVCSISLATLQKCMKRVEPWKAVLRKPRAAP